VGSVAWHLKEELQEICAAYEVRIGKIMKHPIQDLVNFLLKRE